MKQPLFLLVWLLTGTAFSCGEVTPKSDIPLEGDFVKTRVLYSSCAGTIVQLIDEKSKIGKDWLWYKNLNGPFDASNAPETYPRCVSAFNIPSNRQKIGDTLTITYDQLSSPPGDVCALGGMPSIYISAKQIRE